MTMRSPTPSTPRASCRVGCVVAALLVTLGGLRLLVAAEPERLAVLPQAPVVTGVAQAPWPEAVETTVLPVDARVFVAVVEQTSRRIECVPGACGFPRILAPEEAEPLWDALETRIVPAVARSFEPAPPTLKPEPSPWFAAALCTHEDERDCPERLDMPAALAAHF